jgi:predicted PurR-regulated permease PerM
VNELQQGIILDDEQDIEAPDGKPADLNKLGEAFQGPLGIRSLALTGIFVLGCFYTLYLAREFFLPVMLAVVINFLLWPAVRTLARIHIPEALGAGLVIGACLASIGFVSYEFSGPVSTWINRAPQLAQKIERSLTSLRKPVDQVSKATDRLTEPAPAAGPKPQSVVIKRAPLIDSLVAQGWRILFGLAVLVILLYFLLASGDLFLRKLIHVLPRFEDKKRAVTIAREIEFQISRYLVTAALINAGLGAAGALVFWLIGVPNPAVWGMMGAVLNFVPYVGALTTITIVTLVATATFPSLGHALLAPAAYLALAAIEGNFITPYIIGRRLTLNPVVIFIGLTFWGWLWGIPGALLAVPMLVMFKIFCDHTEPLAAIGEFLGD